MFDYAVGLVPSSIKIGHLMVIISSFGYNDNNLKEKQ